MMKIVLFDYAKPLIKRFWEVCLLRKGPEDVPYSLSLLLILVLLGYLLDIFRVTLLLPEVSVPRLTVVLLIYMLVMLLVVAGLLFVLGYRQRIIQSLTTLSGTGIILTLVILPFDYIISLNPERFTMASLMILFVQIWSLVVVGHIFSRALSVHRLMGVIIAIGYLMLGFSVFKYLLPQIS